MTLKIDTLTIKRFRSLRQFTVEGLGRVNLFTGRNNSGKSSVLEAIRILAFDGWWPVISEIIRDREEDIEDMEPSTGPINAENLFQVSSLFHGFPQFSAELEPIAIAATARSRQMDLSMATGWFSEVRDPDGTSRWVLQQDRLFSYGEGVPALVIVSSGVRRVMPLESLRHDLSRGRLPRPESLDRSRLPCVFVSPYGGERTASLGPLWDRIALSDREHDVVEALCIIDPEITAVSMVGGEDPRRSRTAIVRTKDLSRPVPLRSFGDGLNRLFGIMLSLVNAKDGLLLIDEFENGMHHTVQTDVWRAIFQLARRLDIQIMATSHSWDAIQAFQRAAAEDPEDGVLVRLTRRGENIIPTLFREDELAVVTRDHIEVR